MSFVKLHQGLLDSTIWAEDDQTRLVWVTLLLMCNRDGIVESSVPGIAHRARVTLEAAEHALERLTRPDPYSRTPTNEGRRLEAVEGGWRVLNYDYFRHKLSPEEQRRTNAERQKRWRHAQAEKRNAVTVTHRDSSLPNTTNNECHDIAEAEAEADVEADPDPEKIEDQDHNNETALRTLAKETVGLDQRFEQLRAAYPKRSVTGGYTTQYAYVKFCLGHPDGPAAGADYLDAQLEHHKQSAQWRVKGMVPRLDRWLRDGLFDQRFDDISVGEVLNERTTRTLSTAKRFVEEDPHDS